MRHPQLTSQGPGARHGSPAQEATGQQDPKARPLRPCFLCPSLPLLPPRAGARPPCTQLSLRSFPVALTLFPNSQEGTPQGQAQGLY